MTTLAVAALLAIPSPARAASAEESRLLALSNQLRASVGAPALAFDESLADVARRWAAKMAADGTISHNPGLTSQVGSWSKVAENVGMGPDIDTVHRALVNSPPHYTNLVDTGVSLMGIGVVSSGRSVFVVEVFVQRPGGTRSTPATATPVPATTTPRAAPPTTAKPAPAPRPPTTTTTRPAAPAPPPAAAAPAAPAASLDSVVTPVVEALSMWLAQVLEITRAGDRAAG